MPIEMVVPGLGHTFACLLRASLEAQSSDACEMCSCVVIDEMSEGRAGVRIVCRDEAAFRAAIDDTRRWIESVRRSSFLHPVV